ncbi:MAG: spermidine synthase [Planctomycetota bacterium]
MERLAHGRRARSWVFLVLGFSAQLAQVVYLRELFATFRGTELAVGIVLAAWLLWTAAGSATAGRVKHPARSFALAAAALALLIPATLLPLRAIRGWLPVPTGAAPSVGWLALVAFTTLLPVCVLGGAQFVFAARLSRRPARVYALECFGAAAAGVLLTWLLLPFVEALSILVVVSAACLAAALWWVRLHLVAVVFLVLGLLVAPDLDLALRRLFWRQFHAEFELVEARTSAYGSLAVVRYGDQHTLYRDGHPVATAPRAGEAAPDTQLVMLQHPQPERVLMVGGALTGSLREVLRHPVRRVDLIELDPVATELGRRHLGADDLLDPRVSTLHRDGRAFLATTQETYDVIFVQAPDPVTLRANRFYTVEFFRAARRALADGGVFALGHPVAPGKIWSPALLAKLRAVRAALDAVFPRVLVAPGATVLFLAGRDVTLEEEPLLERMAQRLEEPAAIVLRTDVHAVRTLASQMRTGRPFDPLEVESGPAVAADPNRDARPEATFHAVVGIAEVEGDASASLLRFLGRVPWWCLLLPLAALALRRKSLPVAGLGLGAFAMTAQICLLMEFQSLRGYLFEAIGALFACFMAGAGLGSLLAARWRRNWIVVLGLLVGVAVALGPALGVALIAAAIFATGLVSGAGFGLACAGRRGGAGALYAGDVLGACAGALLVPLWLLPVSGTIPTAVVAVAALLVYRIVV